MTLVCLYLDDFASLSETSEEESIRVCKHLTDEIGGDLVFREGVRPEHVPSSCDLYVIDFGGLAANDFTGNTGRRYAQDLARIVRERPSTLFLIWSMISSKYFQCEIADELNSDEIRADDLPANVFLYEGWGPSPIFAKLKALLT